MAWEPPEHCNEVSSASSALRWLILKKGGTWLSTNFGGKGVSYKQNRHIIKGSQKHKYITNMANGHDKIICHLFLNGKNLPAPSNLNPQTWFILSHNRKSKGMFSS